MSRNRYRVFCRTVITGVVGLWPKFRIKRAFHRIKLALFNFILSFNIIEKNKRERRKKYGKTVAQIANVFSYILIFIIIIVSAPGTFILFIALFVGSNV